MDLIVYGLVGILIIGSIGIYGVGLSKIIKLLLGNYIVATLLFSLSKIIDIIIQNVNTVGVETTLAAKNTALSDILSLGKYPLLIIYPLLLFLVYKISKISIVYAKGFLVQKAIKFIYAPLTMLSILFTVWLLLSKMGILNQETIDSLLNNTGYLSFILQNIWIWIFIHSSIVLLITSRINIVGFKEKDPLSENILS